MTAPIGPMHAVLELWPRRREPRDHDIVRALRVANQLEPDPQAPAGLLALAYRLVAEMHEAAGWRLQPSAHLPRCQAAAERARETSAQLVEAVLGELASVEGPVLVGGSLGASHALFGAWDALPDGDAELLLLDRKESPSGAGAGRAALPPIRCRGAGPLRPLFEECSQPGDLRGRDVLVPRLELVAALSAPGAKGLGDLDGLVFCAAAHAAVVGSTWDQVVALAERLGQGGAPRAAVARLGLEDWLELPRKPGARLAAALWSILGR